MYLTYFTITVSTNISNFIILDLFITFKMYLNIQFLSCQLLQSKLIIILSKAAQIFQSNLKRTHSSDLNDLDAIYRKKIITRDETLRGTVKRV